MAWGKIIGGTLGAILGGPIGAGLGIAFGAGFDEDASKKSGDQSAARDGGLSLVQSGNILRLTANVAVPQVATHVVVRLEQGNQPVKSFVEDFKDDDGNFALGKSIVNRPLSLDIPLAALLIERSTPQPIRVIAIVVRNDEQLGYLASSTHVVVTKEPWSAIRWLEPLITLLKHSALRAGTWTPDKVKLIKSAFETLLRGSAAEPEALRDLLKQPIGVSVDECVAAYHRRFDLDSLAALAVFGSAELLSLSGVSQEPRRRAESQGNVLHVHLLTPRSRFQRNLSSNRIARLDQFRASARAYRFRPKSHSQVPAGASRDLIQLAWRRKISELHPDKYTNLPIVVQNMINEKAQELNRARDMLLT